HGYRIERVVERVMEQVVEPAKARLLRTPAAAPSRLLTSDSEAACNT
ncbi:MAG: hypothetical protein IOB05_17695, partial [Burkholderia sp.]|nr:hypothetical protein [Burkholderia sp.]